MKKAIIALIIVILVFVVWSAISSNKTSAPTQDQVEDEMITDGQDSASDIEADLEGLDSTDIEAELEVVDEDIDQL